MLRRALVLFGVLLLTGCGGASLANVATRTQGQRMAVVSMAVNQYGRLHGWEEMRQTPFMADRVGEMLSLAEGQLATRWQVIPTSSFASSPQYLALAGPPQPVVTPNVGGRLLPTLTPGPRELAQGRISPSQAQALAQLTGADLVVLLYAELATETGNWSFTTKPVTKTVLVIYDAAGNRVYYGRRDVMANQVVGGMGHAGFNEGTVQHWIDAFVAGINQLMAS